MTYWLFYKVKQTPEKTIVEFRDVRNGTIRKNFVHKDLEYHGTEPIDKMVERIVRERGWVGRGPLSHDHPAAKAILNGAWEIEE